MSKKDAEATKKVVVEQPAEDDNARLYGNKARIGVYVEPLIKDTLEHMAKKERRSMNNLCENHLTDLAEQYRTDHPDEFE